MMKIVDLYSKVLAVELFIKETEVFHAVRPGKSDVIKRDMNRFISPKMTRAFNHVEAARRSAGAVAYLFGKEVEHAPKNPDKGGVDLACTLIATLAQISHEDKYGVYDAALESYDNYVKAASTVDGLNQRDLAVKMDSILFNLDSAFNLLGVMLHELS